MATIIVPRYTSSVELTNGRASMIGIVNLNSTDATSAAAAAGTQYASNDYLTNFAYDGDIHSFSTASFAMLLTDGEGVASVSGTMQRSLNGNRIFSWLPFTFQSTGLDIAFTDEEGPYYMGGLFSYVAPDGTIKTGRVYQDASEHRYLTWGSLDPATFPVGSITVHAGSITWGPY